MSYRQAAHLVSHQYEYDDPHAALAAALEELDKVRPGQRDADWHHVRGYCFYEQEEPELAEAEFRAALEVDPGQRWANPYSGHCLFDREEFELALEHFLRVDESWLGGLDQPW